MDNRYSFFISLATVIAYYLIFRFLGKKVKFIKTDRFAYCLLIMAFLYMVYKLFDVYIAHTIQNDSVSNIIKYNLERICIGAIGLYQKTGHKQ